MSRYTQSITVDNPDLLVKTNIYQRCRIQLIHWEFVPLVMWHLEQNVGYDELICQHIYRQRIFKELID